MTLTHWSLLLGLSLPLFNNFSYGLLILSFFALADVESVTFLEDKMVSIASVILMVCIYCGEAKQLTLPKCYH